MQAKQSLAMLQLHGTAYQLLFKEARLRVGAIQNGHVLPLVPALLMQLLHEANNCFCLGPLVRYLCHLHHEMLTHYRQQVRLTWVITGRIVSCTYIIISPMPTNGVHHSQPRLHEDAFVPMPGSIAGDKHAIAVAKATCSQLASAKHGKASVKKCSHVCRSTVVNLDLQHA